jgi:glycosyltransferase involved in cell wall biosynthesis
MFLVDDSAIPYSDPWTQPFSTRLARLNRGRHRVAYFYEQPDNSTFRYRVYNMIQALRAAESDISASYFFMSDLAYEDHIIDNCDTLVICRSRYSDSINKFIAKARGRKRTVFFDVDDLVFDTRYTHLIVNTLDQDLAHPNIWDFWFAYFGRLGATLRLCDRAIVTNEFLAARVREFHDVPVSILANFLNLEQVTISDEVYGQKLKTSFARDERIHLGYFSGTPTHNRDFELITEMIARLLAEDSRLRLRVAGYFQPPPTLAPFYDRFEVVPFRDFVSLQKLIGSTEINLIPLQDNVFTNSKSELKYFEAAAVGTISIASPTFVFAGVIEDGVNGYLAKTFEWQDRIYKIIDHMDDYKAMAAVARKHARTTYHWSNQARLIEQALRQ